MDKMDDSQPAYVVYDCETKSKFDIHYNAPREQVWDAFQEAERTINEKDHTRQDFLDILSSLENTNDTECPIITNNNQIDNTYKGWMIQFGLTSSVQNFICGPHSKNFPLSSGLQDTMLLKSSIHYSRKLNNLNDNISGIRHFVPHLKSGFFTWKETLKASSTKCCFEPLRPVPTCLKELIVSRRHIINNITVPSCVSDDDNVKIVFPVTSNWYDVTSQHIKLVDWDETLQQATSNNMHKESSSPSTNNDNSEDGVLDAKHSLQVLYLE